MTTIKNAKEYESALKRLDEIFDAPNGSHEEKELRSLGEKIGTYEDIHSPMGKPKEKDLQSFIKSQSDEKKNA